MAETGSAVSSLVLRLPTERRLDLISHCDIGKMCLASFMLEANHKKKNVLTDLEPNRARKEGKNLSKFPRFPHFLGTQG